MIKFLRAKVAKSALIVGDALFFNCNIDPKIEGAYVALKDENGKCYLVFDGVGPYSTTCVPLDSKLEKLMMIKVKALFRQVLSGEILTQEYDHYIVRPVLGGEKFLATYESSSDDAMLVGITSIPEWVKKEDNLLFDEQGKFLRCIQDEN